MNNTLEYLKNNGIDVDIGLSFLGDEQTYNDILLEFKNNFINQMDEIRKLFESKDIANYAVKVHALKSNCKTLGITSLAELAYNHEMKAKENDINYINSNITSLFMKANEIYQILDKYFRG